MKNVFFCLGLFWALGAQSKEKSMIPDSVALKAFEAASKKPLPRWQVNWNFPLQDHSLFLISEKPGPEKSSNIFLALFDNKTQKKLAEINVADPYFGNKLLGGANLNAFYVDKNIYSVLEINYGGEGEHTGNTFQLYKWDGTNLTKVFETLATDDPVQIQNGVIHTKALFSLCDSCDGPEVADPKDTFILPLEIETGKEAPVFRTKLNDDVKKKLSKSFLAQVEKDKKEQSDYNNKDYANFADKIKEEYLALLHKN